jgi:CRISPR/Cas system CSM-associated protein Csm2 small subunit
MAQCMESWLVADPEALAKYYDQGFNAGALPRRINLEAEPKAQIYTALENATRQTKKGSYGKIEHASALLTRVSQEKAKSRCAHCQRLFTVLETIIHDVPPSV